VGWDFWNKPQTMTTKEAIVKDLEREDGTSPVVDISVVGTVGYVAYRTREDTIVGVVVLTARQRGHFNFGTKMMDEHMGPYNFDCPARILDKLSPLPAEAVAKAETPEPTDFREYEGGDVSAARWRKKCRERAAQKKEAVQLQPGDTIIFPEPLSFGKYGTYSRFTYQKMGNRTVFVPVDTNLPCTITHWRLRQFTVEPAPR
jgi:hypothetical protein